MAFEAYCNASHYQAQSVTIDFNPRYIIMVTSNKAIVTRVVALLNYVILSIVTLVLQYAYVLNLKNSINDKGINRY